MVDPAIVNKEISRLAGLDGFPRGKDQMGAALELRDTLQKAPSREAAHRIVSEWLESQTRCPKPAELRAKIAELRTKGEIKARCSHCDSTGFVVEYVLETFEGNSYKLARDPEVLRDFNHYMEYSLWLAENAQSGMARQRTNTRAIPCPRCSVSQREEAA